jgi:hypothetical protein
MPSLLILADQFFAHITFILTEDSLLINGFISIMKPFLRGENYYWLYFRATEVAPTICHKILTLCAMPSALCDFVVKRGREVQ